MITADELKKIIPTCKRINDFIEPLNNAMKEFGIDDPIREAAFIAQIAHESEEFRFLKEIWGPTASQSHYDSREDLGNTRPEAIEIAKSHGSTPGKWWKGHGPIQITGYDEHSECGEELGLDLLNNPELIAEPVNGCRSAAWYWKKHKCNELADAGDFASITRRINGGMNGWNSRLEYWTRAKNALGVNDV